MNETTDQAIDQLRKAVIAQKTVNLEETPDRSELTRLHDALREYDAHVSEQVIRVLQGGAETADFPNRMAVESELEQAQAHTDPMVIRDVRKYVQYKQRLDTMLSLVKQVADERKNQA